MCRRISAPRIEKGVFRRVAGVGSVRRKLSVGCDKSQELEPQGTPFGFAQGRLRSTGGKLPGLMQPVREGLIKSLLAPDVALNAGVFAGEGARATLDQRFLRGWRL